MRILVLTAALQDWRRVARVAASPRATFHALKHQHHPQRDQHVVDAAAAGGLLRPLLDNLPRIEPAPIGRADDRSVPAHPRASAAS